MSHEAPAGARDVKPRLRAASIPILVALDRHIRDLDYRGHDLRHAASDRFDGWLYRRELDDLIRRRLLTVICDRDPDWNHYPRDLCGRGWSVDLTDRAIAAFWPDRVAPRTADMAPEGR